MTNHTPGPWHTNTDEMARWPEQIGCCPLTGRPYSIAVGTRNVAAACTAADARLIAAAPDLLKALKTLADRNITYWSEDGEVRSNFGSQQKAMEAFRLARSAIKKAAGDENDRP